MAVQAKQISKIITGHIKVSGFNTTAANSDVITTALSTALATAGAGGVSVPLQASSGDSGIGVVTLGSSNRVEINDGSLDDGNGNEVYGRLTESGGVYTLSYYSLIANVETAYTFGSAETIDFEFSYRFDFERLPPDFAVVTAYKVLSGGGGGSGGHSVTTELVTVTATNTLADLAKTPDVTANVFLVINGLAYSTLGNADFSLAGKAITWNQANAGFPITTTDKVIAQYTTLE